MKPEFMLALGVVIGMALPAGAADDWQVEVEGQVAFTEGPVWHPSGNVYFSDIENNRIMRRDAQGVMHVYRTPSGRSNGLVFDCEGRMIACEGHREGGNRRITRMELDGTLTVLADRFEGGRFNSPNDVTIDSKGRIYFTDPRYRDREGLELFDKSGKAVEGVYRIDTNGKVTRVIAHEVDRPNGIAVSTDDQYLFVADNNPDMIGRNRKLWRFDLKPDGSVDTGSRKELFNWGTDRGPDGMAIDRKNRLYVTAGLNHPALPAQTSVDYKAGVYLISKEGNLEGFIPIPADMITNCAFGGDDLRTLFVTAGHKLWSVRMDTPGKVVWPVADK